jgi:hypothetical protein
MPFGPNKRVNQQGDGSNSTFILEIQGVFFNAAWVMVPSIARCAL